MNQFVCLVYILFLFAGVVCGLISGLIGYEVFAELYKKVTGTTLPFFSIPLLIVFSLEITKIFLVFLDKQASLTNNAGIYQWSIGIAEMEAQFGVLCHLL